MLERLIQDEDWFSNFANYIPLTDQTILENDIEKLIETYDEFVLDQKYLQNPNLIITGNVFIEDNVNFIGNVVIEGPAFIGRGSTIGPNCYLRSGTYIGENCQIRQCTEIKGSVLLNSVRFYHFGYIGNSIIGNRANIGAGFISAVRRFDNQNVNFRFEENNYEGSVKGGCIIGDDVQIGIGVKVMPGRVITPLSIINPGEVVKSTKENKTQNELDQEEHVWAAIMQTWDKEADRFWTRNNVFLTINGAMLVFVTSFSTDLKINLLVTIFGMIFCIIWMRVNQIGKYYLDRWKEPLKKIELDWHIKPITRINELATEHPLPLKLKSSSKYMIILIKYFVSFWALLFLLNLWRLFIPIITDNCQIFKVYQFFTGDMLLFN